MADKWDEIIENSDSGNATVIDVNAWLGKATLDTYVRPSSSVVCVGRQTKFISQGSVLELSTTTSAHWMKQITR